MPAKSSERVQRIAAMCSVDPSPCRGPVWLHSTHQTASRWQKTLLGLRVHTAATAGPREGGAKCATETTSRSVKDRLPLPIFIDIARHALRIITLPTWACPSALRVLPSMSELISTLFVRCARQVTLKTVFNFSSVTLFTDTTHIREYTGQQLDMSTQTCVNCPAHSINPGQGLSCTNCSSQFYTNTSSIASERHTCLACPRGKIRQEKSHYTLCEFCPTLFALSERTQQCELCVQPVDPTCLGQEFGTTFVDDCSLSTDSPHGCICGCRVCELFKYRGIVDNFLVLAGCVAACDDGYKLQRLLHHNSPFVCTKNADLFHQSEFAVYNNGHVKFSTRNSSDFTLTPCFSLFSLSLLQLDSFLHIMPSLPSARYAHNLIRVNNSILASYITHLFDLQDIDSSCSFRCSDGYTPRSSLYTNISECVSSNHTPCITSLPSFSKVSSCLIG